MPIAFWWLSLIGAMLELMYFMRQQDSVGIAGYFFSVVPYTRNLVLIYRKRRLEAEAGDAVSATPLAKSGSEVKRVGMSMADQTFAAVPTLSICVPVYDEAENLPLLHARDRRGGRSRGHRHGADSCR